MLWLALLASLNNSSESAPVRPRIAPPAMLTPGPQELAQISAQAQKLADEAEAVGIAAARLQNRLAELFVAGGKPTCDQQEISATALRASIFAQHHRDLVQSARMQDQRLKRVLNTPTIMPLLDTATQKRLEALSRRLFHQLQLHLELAGWHKKHVANIIQQCKPTLTPAEGLADPVARMTGETPAGVAIIALRGAMVCPAGVPANNNVIVVHEGLACYSATEGDCVCQPSLVLPGAVIGPP